MIHRMAYISTQHTGGSLQLFTPEGVLEAHRLDPHGVQFVAGGQGYSIQKRDIAIVGRYFLAAGVMLGLDINDGWDATQDSGTGLVLPL